MSWFDRKRVPHFKKRVRELLKIPKALMERLTKWKDINDKNNNNYDKKELQKIALNGTPHLLRRVLSM